MRSLSLEASSMVVKENFFRSPPPSAVIRLADVARSASTTLVVQTSSVEAALINVRIDFAVNDTKGDVLALLARLRQAGVWRAHNEQVHFDLGDSGYLGPAATVTLGNVVRQLRECFGCTVTATLPNKAVLAAYCGYAGLRQLFGGAEPTEDARSVTIPLFNTTTAVEQTAILKTVRLVRAQVGLDGENEQRLSSSMAELMQNIADHSKTPVGGFISAKAFKGEKEVRVAIADGGVGIAETMGQGANGHRFRHAIDHFGAAFVRDGTAQTLPRNRGIGLADIDEIARDNGGRLTVLSRDHSASRHGLKAMQFATCRVPYPGTIAILTLKIRPSDEPVSAADIEI